jgi:glycosyltransferase involved in cell wall biosynthesis
LYKGKLLEPRASWCFYPRQRIDVEYFEREIKPQIDGKQIEYLGEATDEQKTALMGGAVATLFPITWREPFGLVMVESMATGTPVIGMELGSTPEVIAHGRQAFCVATLKNL